MDYYRPFFNTVDTKCSILFLFSMTGFEPRTSGTSATKVLKNCPRTLKFSQSSKITPNLVTLQVVYVTAFERAHKGIIWSTPVRSQVEAKVFSVEKRMIERTEQKNKALRGSKEEKIKYNLRLKSHLMDLLISAIIIARLNMPLMNLS